LNGDLLTIGAIRESYLKPVLYFLMMLMCCVFIGWAYRKLVENRQEIVPPPFTKKWFPIIISIGTFIGILIILVQPQLKQYALPTQFWLDSNHFIISILILIGIFVFAIQHNRNIFKILFSFLVVALIAGVLMISKLPLINYLTRLRYTVFDLVLVFSLIGIIIIGSKNLVKN
jgi:hypothetical protein